MAVVGPLSDPGPDSPTAQAFDVVVPSLPGFGFSEAPRERGWGLKAVADCFNNLMTKVLKYETYCVQGGDWGSMIARRMALDFGNVPAPPSAMEKFKGFFSAEKMGGGAMRGREQGGLMSASASASSSEEEGPGKTGGGILAIHQNMAVAAPRISSPRTFLQLLNAPFAHVAPIFITKDEAKGLRGLLIYQTKESGYFKIQSTKPMTLGFGLSDSPVAALAWVSVSEEGEEEMKKGEKVVWGGRESVVVEFFFLLVLLLLSACLLAFLFRLFEGMKEFVVASLFFFLSTSRFLKKKKLFRKSSTPGATSAPTARKIPTTLRPQATSTGTTSS